MKQNGKNSATTNEDSLLKVGQSHFNPLTLWSALLRSLAVIVVPGGSLRKGIGHLLEMHMIVNTLGAGHFRSDQDLRTEHELRFDIPETGLIGEFIPHGAHKRLSGVSSLFNRTVNVVNEVVSAIDGVSDSLTDSTRLHPGFPIMQWEGQVYIL